MVSEVTERLNTIRSLFTGWCDGEGVALDSGYLDWVEDVLATALIAGMRMPRLYPSLEGEVHAEWDDLKFPGSSNLHMGSVTFHTSMNSYTAMLIDPSTDETITITITGKDAARLGYRLFNIIL